MWWPSESARPPREARSHGIEAASWDLCGGVRRQSRSRAECPLILHVGRVHKDAGEAGAFATRLPLPSCRTSPGRHLEDEEEPHERTDDEEQYEGHHSQHGRLHWIQLAHVAPSAGVLATFLPEPVDRVLRVAGGEREMTGLGFDPRLEEAHNDQPRAALLPGNITGLSGKPALNGGPTKGDYSDKPDDCSNGQDGLDH